MIGDSSSGNKECTFQIDIAIGWKISITSVYLRPAVNDAEFYEMSGAPSALLLNLEKWTYTTNFQFNSSQGDQDFYVQIAYQIGHSDSALSSLTWKSNSETLNFVLGMKF